MPRPTLSTLAAAAAWGAVGLVVLGLTLLFTDIGRPGKLTLPIMFWTYDALLVLVALGLAIGLPAEKGAFWRSFVVTLAASALLAGDGRLLYAVFEVFVPEQIDAWQKFAFRDNWMWGVMVRLIIVGAALVTGTAAALWARWPSPTTRAAEPFRFSLAHLFIVATLVALSCVAWRAAGAFTFAVTQLCVVSLVIFIGIATAARRAPPALGWGYLAGVFGCAILANQGLMLEEWHEATARHGELRDFLAPSYRSIMVSALLPAYAGLMTGILAALVYRLRE